jgi:ubiquinone biosynthesis protein COQ9
MSASIMTDSEFDRALIEAAFRMAAEQGWSRMSVAKAALAADLPLARARARFPCRAVVVMRFGRQADQAALEAAAQAAPVRDQLFDMLMRRIDALQAQRAGMLALFRALPADPPLLAMLANANLLSMRWILEAAGASGRGLSGLLRAKGLVLVWLWTVRAWSKDETVDLSATMAALDQALSRAENAESWLHPNRQPAPPPEPPPPPPEPDLFETAPPID